MKKTTLFLIITCLLFFQSCGDNPAGPETDRYIAQFIESQKLPKVQPYEVSFFNHQENVTVFELYFGFPFDCPSGCAYSVGMGLKYKNKIGWLYLNGLSETDLEQKIFYDFNGTETYLFSESFWSDLDKADQWIYRYALLPNLVKDNDIPLSILKRIAQGLYSFIDPHLVELLLLNTKVINDKIILTLLANLPVSQGDSYSFVREKARQLLTDLE